MNVGWLLLLTFTLHGVVCELWDQKLCAMLVHMADVNALLTLLMQMQKTTCQSETYAIQKWLAVDDPKRISKRFWCVLISFAQDPKNEWLWLEEYTKFFHESSNCRRTLIEKFSLFLGTSSSKDTILRKASNTTLQLAIKEKRFKENKMKTEAVTLCDSLR